MIKRKRQESELEIPLSAMIDVVFLLLIFFILTYREESIEANLAINIPTGHSTQNASHKLLEVRVHPGEYSLMGTKSMGLEQLTNALATLTRYDADQTVVIKVHKQAKHRELIALLDRCKKIGINKLNVQLIKN